MPALSLLKKADDIAPQDGHESGRPIVRWKLSYGHLPVKRSINFVTVGEKPIDWRIAIPAIAVIIVLSGLLSKVAVIDRFAALNEARSEVYRLQQTIQERTDYYNGLTDISEDYAHYMISDMTEEEKNRISRVTVMDVVQQLILPVAPLDAWSLTENTLSISLSSNTLTEITSMIEQLQANPSVLSCTVQSESTTVSSKDNVATEETITAEVVITFKSATQIQEENKAAEQAAEEAAQAAANAAAGKE